jgi:hypothetical protein
MGVRINNWAVGLALSAALGMSSAGAQSLDEVIAGAKKEGAILWYDSLPAEQGNAIL